MNFALKEMTEIAVKRFDCCPLAKMSEGKIFDKPMSEYDKPFQLIPETKPEKFLTDKQIEAIREKSLKLDLSENEIEVKIQEYAEKSKACKEAEEKGLGSLPTEEKGNYGEMKTDLDMLDKGYIRISKDSITELKGGHKGIDGVYQNPDNGNPSYAILDAKYGSSQLQDTNDGKQLSDTWIDKRLDSAVGKEKADELREAMLDDNVGIAVANIDPDGNCTYCAVDSVGEIIDNKEVFNND